MRTSLKIAVCLMATGFLAACNSTNPQAPSASAPAASPAKTSSWDGEWTGAWGGSAATRVVINGENVVNYYYKGSSVPAGATSVSGDRLSFGTSNYTISMVRTGATTAKAHYQQGTTSADAVLTRK